MSLQFNLRLDAGGVFAVGIVDIRGVDTNIKVLYNNAVGLQVLNQILVVDRDNFCHLVEIITNFECLDFAEGCGTRVVVLLVQN